MPVRVLLKTLYHNFLVVGVDDMVKDCTCYSAVAV